MTEATTEPLVTVDELARRLNVSTRTLRRWREDGMPHYMRGFVIRFRVSEVEAWMRDNNATDGERPAA